MNIECAALSMIHPGDGLSSAISVNIGYDALLLYVREGLLMDWQDAEWTANQRCFACALREALEEYEASERLHMELDPAPEHVAGAGTPPREYVGAEAAREEVAAGGR